MTPSLVLAEHAHGFLGGGPLIWAIAAVAFVISVLTIRAAVRMTLHPGEEEPDHVKRSILAAEDAVYGLHPGANQGLTLAVAVAPLPRAGHEPAPPVPPLDSPRSPGAPETR